MLAFKILFSIKILHWSLNWWKACCLMDQRSKKCIERRLHVESTATLVANVRWLGNSLHATLQQIPFFEFKNCLFDWYFLFRVKSSTNGRTNSIGLLFPTNSMEFHKVCGKCTFHTFKNTTMKNNFPQQIMWKTGLPCNLDVFVEGTFSLRSVALKSTFSTTFVENWVLQNWMKSPFQWNYGFQ